MLRTPFRLVRLAVWLVALTLGTAAHADPMAEALAEIELTETQAPKFSKAMEGFAAQLKMAGRDRSKMRQALSAVDAELQHVLNAEQWGRYLKYKQLVASRALDTPTR